MTTDEKPNYVCVFVELQPGIKLKLKEPELKFFAKNSHEAFYYVVNEILYESRGDECVKVLEVYEILRDGSRKRLDRWEAGAGWVAPSTPRTLFEKPHSATWREDGRATQKKKEKDVL
jgi:hypothetical protein